MNSKNLNIFKNKEDFLKKFKNNEYNSIIIVTNETGLGVIPENKLARMFIDKIGYLNKKMAEISDSFYFMVSGIPVKIKYEPFKT